MAARNYSEMIIRNECETLTRDDGKTSGCIFLWKIGNISDCWWFREGQFLPSPGFSAEGLEGTKWRLLLYSMGEDEEDGVGLYLHREKGCVGPDVIQVKYQLAFLGEDRSVLVERTEMDSFKKGASWGFSKFEEREIVFVNDRKAFLPEDTLTVQCTLQRAEEETLVKPKHLYVQTVLNARRTSFDWRMDKFSTLQPGVRKKFKNNLIELDLVLKGDFCNKLEIDLISFNNSLRYMSCNTSVMDSEGKMESCGINKYFDADLKKGILPSVLTFPSKILENKSHYMKNDILSLDFDVVLSTVHYYNCKEYSTKAEKNVVKRNESFRSAEQDKYENKDVLIEDFKAMYNDCLFSDTELRTSTKKFPAHKNILSARSPVFRSMFSHDMKEKNSGHVDIDDLDDDTVHRMLLYMYTGLLEDLQLESASKLYTAGDKYEILSLKSRCSSFLKENLSLANACRVLLLADLHQDDDLKNAVEVYILEHGEVFKSLHWKNLMDTNSKLAADIMYKKINPDMICNPI